MSHPEPRRRMAVESEPAIARRGNGQRRGGRDRHWAVCCSGGGIRSAAFCLGALQELEKHVLPQAKTITAVSGGSFIAAGRAFVDHELHAPEAASGPSRRPYEPGSPEERHLRGHTRYMVPGLREGVAGVSALLVGAILMLALLLSWIFLFGQLFGRLLSWSRVLVGLGGQHPQAIVFGWNRWWWWMFPATAGLVALAAALASGWPGAARHPGTEKASSTTAVRSGFVAAMLALLMLGAPAAIQGLYHVGLTNASTAGTVVRAVGFASAPAIEASPTVHKQATISPSNPAPQSGTDTRSGGWWGVVAGLGAAIAALAKAAAGRISALSSAAEKQKWLSPYLQSLTQAARRFLVPWIGSAIIVAGLSVLSLLWIADGTLVPFSSRWWIFAVLAVPLLGRSAMDVNRTSLHDFYRWRLTKAYGFDPTRPEPERRTGRAQHRPDLLLSDLAGDDQPTLALCATSNVNAAGEAPAGRGGYSFVFDPNYVTLHDVPITHGGRSDEVETYRDTRAPTRDYELYVGRDRLTLFDIVAIAGAAVSPLMGKMTRHSQRLLYTVANIRLGIWLPRPQVVVKGRKWLDQHSQMANVRYPWMTLLRYMLPHRRYQNEADGPSNDRERTVWDRESELWGHMLWYRQQVADPPEPWSGAKRFFMRLKAAALWRTLQPTMGLLLREAVLPTDYRQTWMLVTDGGHYDNSGLVAALHDERVTDVVVLDASGDKADTWNTIGQAIALARSDVGVEIVIDPTDMTRPADAKGTESASTTTQAEKSDGKADDQVTRPWAAGTFTRRDGRTRGRIWVCKGGVWSKAPWDVRAYGRSHVNFPCASTANQLYNENQFEAYHALGAATVRATPLPSQEPSEMSAQVVGVSLIDVAPSGRGNGMLRVFTRLTERQRRRT